MASIDAEAPVRIDSAAGAADSAPSFYQKGGITANGIGVSVQIRDNVVTGDGPTTRTAQNGIQIGYGATATVMKNTVTGNSYTGGY